MTMVDMKRRVAAIMEFISRTQVDLAAEAACQTSSSSSSGDTSPQKPTSEVNEGGTADEMVSTKDFRDLSCIEMMDVLTRDMVKWQNHYT